MTNKLTMDTKYLSYVLTMVTCERERQHRKWGEQNWPSLDPALADRDATRVTEEYEVPSEARAKFLCEEAFKRGQGTWAHILVEEVSEALSTKNDVDLIEELIQVAAVATAWAECLLRNHNKEKENV